MLKHHKGDFASLKILLMLDIFVRRHHHFETGLLGKVDQFAVRQLLPALRPCFLHGMACKETGKTSRLPLSKRINIKASAHR